MQKRWTLENYIALENFETFKRPENMKISDSFEESYIITSYCAYFT